jgi:hypothetical protein
MPIFTAMPGAPATDPARVAAYLQGKGYVLGDGVSLHGDGNVSIDADRDPTADLASYTDAPTPQEQAVLTAVAYLKATYVPSIQAILPANRTPEQRALLAITVILKSVLTP